MVDTTRELLNEREERYGKFCELAEMAQAFKRLLIDFGYYELSDSQKESLDMIMHKIARILNGDPDYADNWVDIAGYAQLVADELDAPKDTRQEDADIAWSMPKFHLDNCPPF